jgi:capsule polysaccharide export protein KpsE/RkpR
MATKEITKRELQYPGPELDPGLVLEAEEVPREGWRIVAKLNLLWENRQFLFRCAAIGLVASTIIAFLIPVRYTSTTRLMPPDQSGQGMASMLAAFGKATGGLGSIGGEMLGLKTSGDLFVGVLQSRGVQDDVINKFDLRKVYGLSRYEDTRKVLESRTEVFADRKSGIITVAVSDGSRERAQAMGQEYVEALNHVVTTLNTSSAHKERAFLEERLVQVQQDLEKAEKDFSQFASQNTAIDVKEQGKAMISAAAEVEGQLISAETELEGLRQTYTANNVRVRSVQARIDEYRHQLQKLGGQIPAGAEGGTALTDRAPEEHQDLYPSIRRLPLLGVRWADLYRQTKVQETVLETLTEQYELAKVEEARETPSVKVLDAANKPERKSFPPRMILMMFGTGFVCVFASLWVLVHARWEQIDPSDPGKILLRQVFQSVRSCASRISNHISRKPQARDEIPPG